MAEFISKYPRIVAFLFAAILAGLAAAIVGFPLHDMPHLIILIIVAMISTGFWMAIIGKRIADVTQSCTDFRAAILGAIATSFAVFSVGVFIGMEMRLENLLNDLASFQQTIRFLFIDDLAANFGGGIFVLLFVGWYLVPIGGFGGIFLRELRKLYEPKEADEQYAEAQSYRDK